MSRPLFHDLSLSAISAGFIAVLVGFASSVAIVFQAAQAAGATEAMMQSWIFALGLGMGLTCIGFSWYYKAPVITAWSTPGAALLATSLLNVPIAQAIGAFIFAALLTLLLGLSGAFDRLSKRIPMAIASAMLAGILVQFGLAIFTSMKASPLLVGIMLATYLLTKKFVPRYAIILVLLSGLIASAVVGKSSLDSLSWQLATPVWVWPELSWSVLLGVGLPLFIVTMTSQNIPGVATLRASGYESVPVSPVLTGTGLTSLILAPLGGFAFNLAAITAAICTGAESHPDKDKRYVAGLSAGFFYVLAGLCGATVVALFAALPTAMVATLAGLALLGTIANSLALATQEVKDREAAMVTFLLTASGVSFFGIGAAFWGLVGGMLTWFFMRAKP
ncbi:benzoate/H(+) symporter BenE family transporter [Aliiglaciecola sp. CAU 1673]|uniref:benzoate/H(+) symporter BenE family transporter n=1 Tax=Aliiglaciecola sp. CAU 1673 TaxID=3032595 RepID=UPI0023DBCE5E|nr:benzoate/H(+) symporter BenE family transporter [Aliiglaciecola sp. CAU 1673]MDF2178398.1 benzoate/H(+) symporter BenE family transporter [Aliiglaciecola sp. CAU 1673]